VSKTGKIYITGSTVTLDDFTSPAKNMLLLKYDMTTLAADWMKGWGSYSGNEVGLDIKATYDEGYFYVVGYSNSFTQFTGSNNPVVAKFETGGTHIWSRGIGGNALGYLNSVDMPDDDSYVYCAGTTQIWTITAGTDAGVLVKISSAGDLQWVREYSSAATQIQFNKVVVLKDHSAVWTLGNSAGTVGILVKWGTGGVDTLTLVLASMADITSATLFVDQSTIFIGGQTSTLNTYVGALRLSDNSLVLTKYFSSSSTNVVDMSVNDYGEVALAVTSSPNNGIIHFDADFNDVCTALTITPFAGALTANVATYSTLESSVILYPIIPIIVTNTITDATSTTTFINATCGDM
jgi:hypothetical protein